MESCIAVSDQVLSFVLFLGTVKINYGIIVSQKPFPFQELLGCSLFVFKPRRVKPGSRSIPRGYQFDFVSIRKQDASLEEVGGPRDQLPCRAAPFY